MRLQGCFVFAGPTRDNKSIYVDLSHHPAAIAETVKRQLMRCADGTTYIRYFVCHEIPCVKDKT